MEKQIEVNEKLVAYCGLYCAECKKHKKGSCPGCHDNEKASWCKVRKCCIENNYESCADCKLMPIEECKYYNNFMSKVFGYIFNSDRKACINRIKEIGHEGFANEMTEKKQMSIKRK
ncbi:MAG: DUF3795 domain-containing protein [Bacteroidetes bacterium]|jgi:hypothetical protein|nr:DUF3795 domain-containing protein [Bacteroidota bacterium]MBT6685066.1 DUF3795 domain-containing protein [Bacteroidota bacterium]MBT7144555.1 DUF3795 domain-containing protein [Bacteroidota bacterium]MBT7491780.1 DUF3795 domain-containing protein [Bacteroidota bacterium]